MIRLVTAIAISTIVLGASAGLAGAADKIQLTTQERTEMRQRAERLIAARESMPAQGKSTVRKSPRPKHVQ